MRRDRQIGVRVGMPAFFVLELEDVYKRSEGPHKALAFADFVGLLVGMGLERYREQHAPAMPEAESEPEGDGEGEDWDFPPRAAGRNTRPVRAGNFIL